VDVIEAVAEDHHLLLRRSHGKYSVRLYRSLELASLHQLKVQQQVMFGTTTDTQQTLMIVGTLTTQASGGHSCMVVSDSIQ
jgi:hypothetical protein